MLSTNQIHTAAWASHRHTTPEQRGIARILDARHRDDRKPTELTCEQGGGGARVNSEATGSRLPADRGRGWGRTFYVASRGEVLLELFPLDVPIEIPNV